MKINLNDATEFTLENFKKLIASEDDSAHTQLQVSRDGYLVLSREIPASDDKLFVLGSFQAGNDYVGIEASKDEAWMNQVFNAIKANWPKPISCYIDSY